VIFVSSPRNSPELKKGRRNAEFTGFSILALLVLMV
jgi:hypothetical protein